MSAFDQLTAQLDVFAKAGKTLNFWWRDDDAVTVTTELEAILSISARYHVPLALAVIPEPLEDDLAPRIRDCPEVSVFLHGWAHKNHADKAAGERASEFGDGRPVAESLNEMRRGHDKLSAAFGDDYLPVFTPPWNRIGAEAAARRCEAGLVGLTSFAKAFPDDRRCINTHVDIINWKAGRIFGGIEKAIDKLNAEIEARESDQSTPIGILSHHLVHDEAANRFLDNLFKTLACHSAAHFPGLKELFEA